MTRVHTGIGIALGLCFGAALGAATRQAAVGVSFGVALGAALDLMFGATLEEPPARKKHGSRQPLPRPLDL